MFVLYIYGFDIVASGLFESVGFIQSFDVSLWYSIVLDTDQNSCGVNESLEKSIAAKHT